MSQPITISKDMMAAMAAQVHLPIDESRLEDTAANTAALISSANHLAEKMMDLQYLELAPASVLRLKK